MRHPPPAQGSTVPQVVRVSYDRVRGRRGHLTRKRQRPGHSFSGRCILAGSAPAAFFSSFDWLPEGKNGFLPKNALMGTRSPITITVRVARDLIADLANRRPSIASRTTPGHHGQPTLRRSRKTSSRYTGTKKTQTKTTRMNQDQRDLF